MSDGQNLVTIGELATRTGVATSALHFYEERGLIQSQRTAGNQRRYGRSVVRQVSVIRAAQKVGVSLADIGEALAALPPNKSPTKRDWGRMSRSWRQRLDDQIADLERLRDDLNDCIGCGCLSLKSCALYNANDRAASFGTGARYLTGDYRGRDG